MSLEDSLLFVYGSLRRHYEHPMADLLAAKARHLGRASVPGRLYLVSWYPGFVPGEDRGPECPRVTGDLFALEPNSAPGLLEELDAYEGNEFERRKIQGILKPTGGDFTAWAYALAVDPQSFRQIPSGNFFERGHR